MSSPQSQLARYVPRPSTSDVQVLALGARAWGDGEVLVVRLSTVQDPSIRHMVRAIAAYCYGRDRG